MIMIVLHILFSAVKSFMGLFIVVKRFLITSVTQVGLSQAKPRFPFSIKSVSFNAGTFYHAGLKVPAELNPGEIFIVNLLYYRRLKRNRL